MRPEEPVTAGRPARPYAKAVHGDIEWDEAQFGSDRLLAAARSAAGGTAAQLVAAVRAAVERFSNVPHDDIALLAVRAGP